METVAAALLRASGAGAQHRHLCLTPLSTLLENIGGVYAPLMAGACCCVPSLQRVGLTGASGLNPAAMLQALHEFEASTAILAPQMLQALVAMLERGAEVPPLLHFVAVGGAPASPHLLARAAELGLPVYEGYGLSECGSVVALNAADSNRRGTVGKPLPHTLVCFAADGEILVDGAVFLGYLGHGAAVRPWPTGDIGFLDEDGYLHVTGRKKSVFITALGRNVAPEWVERELTLHPAIAQAAVFGEAKPWNCAVIVPRADADASSVAAAVAQVNQLLPDYARVGRWLPAGEAFTPGNGQLTANGRLRRAAIVAAYSDRIEALYQENTHDIFC
jgi:long-subunit acyl-CoA synthetase (AMP-forming)